MNKLKKEDNYQIYVKAHNNAVSLVGEAELLHKNKHYARSYFLAFTGLEELSKSQLAADVYTEFIKEEEFWTKFTKHNEKIQLLGWASHDAERYLDWETEDYVEISVPKVKSRMGSLYVDIENSKIISPKDAITAKESKSLIHTLTVAIDRITETEFFNDRIGTKGFLK
jgi:AbiV family abortive infection protein